MSAILSADDLNDFISPGVACIKPVETLPKNEDSNPYEVTTEDKVQVQNPAPASISLTDCLACSGCVTSAEAVLVSLQSQTEVLNTLDAYSGFDSPSLEQQNGNHPSSEAKIFVASVSPQVRASIAAVYGISERRAGYIIEQFLSGSQGLRLGGKHGTGFNYVVDTNTMREACLVLGAEEVANSLSDTTPAKPILTSACPGWICYVEKTHPHIIPHLSTLKSPQALTGTILKSVLSKQYNVHPSQIWHLAIMPCFDKKLEASREELTDRWWQHDLNIDTTQPPVRDVDCVITARELLTLASARDVQLAQLPAKPVRQAHFPDTSLSRFLLRDSTHRLEQSPDAGSSGGYLYHILETQQALHSGSNISIQRGRNADVVDYLLVSASGQTIMKCARYYGFRNIQNLVRKLKPVRQSKLPGAVKRKPAAASGSDYAYVEVMACPGGCTNGGGQIKVEDVTEVLPDTRGEQVARVDGLAQKEWLQRIDEAYYSADSGDELEDANMVNGDGLHDQGDMVNGINIREVKKMLDHWSSLVEVPLDRLAYTTFRQVESDVGKKAKDISDSQRIAAVAGMSGGGW